MTDADKTRQVLQDLLADLYAKQAMGSSRGGSYLVAANKQLLGNITDNRFDRDSILNEYGPYGSVYSATSIFNKYSPYGSIYGQFSMHNPYSATPPQLFIRGVELGVVSTNRYVAGTRIEPEAFLYALRHYLPALLDGRIVASEGDARTREQQSFVIGQDGQFLGRLDTNRFDPESIANKFGPYGSQFSQTSIYNRFCPYGGAFSELSASNRMASQPPRVFVDGLFAGYLTENLSLGPRISVEGLEKYIGRSRATKRGSV
jgi:hypothetical protein